MLSMVFGIMMVLIFGKILGFALKAAWGLSKIVCTVLLLPLLLVVLVIVGLIQIALPILLIAGIVSLCLPKSFQ